MSMFRVSSAVLRQKADELERMNDQFKRRVDELQQQERNLANMWEGEARDAFHQEFNKDYSKFLEFYNGIAKYIQALRSTAQQYEAAERVNLCTAKSRHS